MSSCSRWLLLCTVFAGPFLFVTACTGPEAFRADAPGGGGLGGSIGVGSGGTGGSVGSGGSLGSGGTMGSGGTIATGGTVVGTGGRSGTGGTTGTGGAMGTGGRVGTGGTVGTGGSAGAGGRNGTGGGVGSGGTVGSGGMVGGGGTGGGPTGTMLFSDNFESGNASRWMTTTSDWSVVTDGTLVYKEGGPLSSTTRLASVLSVGNDIAVEAKVKVLAFAGQSTSYQVEICARFQDPNNYYYAALDSTGKVAIKKNTATASNMTLASIADGIVTNTWYAVKFQVVGPTLTVFVDGVQKATAIDPEIASGGFAVGTRNATAEFDDVRVTAP